MEIDKYFYCLVILSNLVERLGYVIERNKQ